MNTVEAAVREPLLLWQIKDVERGTGLHLKDLCTGRSVFAHGLAATESMKRFDIMLAQVTLVDGIYTLNATAPFAISGAYQSSVITATSESSRLS